MKYLFLLLPGLFGLAAATSAQPRCEIKSMQHFGGNSTDQIFSPVTQHPDGTFSLRVATSSTTGSINTSCAPAPGHSRRYFFRTYSADGSTVLGESCAPTGSNFSWATFHVYPQANGDTILIGTSETPLTSYDISIERRYNGQVLWNKTYGGSGSESANIVVPAVDSGFFIMSGTNSSDGDVGLHYGSEFDGDTWVLRVNNNGDKLWAKVLGGSSYDLARTLIPTPDGGCMVFGSTTSDDYDATGMKGVSDLWIVRLDSLGNKLWHKCLGGTGEDGCAFDNGVFALPDSSGGYYVLNRTASFDGDVQRRMPSADGQADFWLLHIDSLAHVLWENTYGANEMQYPSAFCRGADHSFWLVGTLNGGAQTGGDVSDYYGGYDCWIVHTDSLGHLLNQRTLGAEREQLATVAQPLPNGDLLVAGNYVRDLQPGTHESPGFPRINEGDYDVFIGIIGPNAVAIKDTMLPDIAWALYPNPAGNELTVQLQGLPAKGYTLTLTDAAGRQVLQQTLKKETTTISLKSLANGAYQATLRDAQDRASVKKIVKQE